MKIGLVGIVKKHGAVFLAGLIFAVLCFIGINIGIEHSSSSEFCGSQCHEMKTAYQSWELSVHGTNNYGIEVACIDCHLPSKEDKFFRHLVAKAYAGGKDILVHHFGGEYDVEKSIAKVKEHISDEVCLNCHNNLLAKGSNSAARKAHSEILNSASESKQKCIECHENVAHQRQKKIFSE